MIINFLMVDQVKVLRGKVQTVENVDIVKRFIEISKIFCLEVCFKKNDKIKFLLP